MKIQFSSVTQSCPTLCNHMNCSMPGLPVYHQLPEFTQIPVHQVSDIFQPLFLCCPLLLLPPIPPRIRVFSNESTLRMRWPKYLRNIITNKASGGDGIPVELFQILKDYAVKVLHSICQQIWKTQQWPQDWQRSVFLPVPKKGNAKECSAYHTIALISH